MDSTRRRSSPTRSLRAVLAAGCVALLLAFLPAAARAGDFVAGPSSDVTVGYGPRAIATGDLNEDGGPDMVVGHEGSSGVSVLLGQAGGGFAPAVSYDTGEVPGEVVVADLDGDGHLDFAVGHYDQNTIVIMLGDGTGAFTPGPVLAGPPHPEGLTAVDLDYDGKPDLAACGYDSYDDGVASVWLNTGGPGALAFGDRSDYATGAWPNSIRSGVFANYQIGLVTANYNGSSVTVLENDGTGHFPTRTDLPVPEHVYMAAVGNLFPSLDRSQIVTANADASTVTLYRWNPTTSSWFRQDFATGNRPSYVAIADADGDSSPDVVTSNYVSGDLSVLSADQWHGTLHPHVDIPSVTHPYAVAVADFDLDGKPDLVASDRTGNTVRVTRGAAKVGWGLNDTIPEFAAKNQNGDLWHVVPGNGKWRLLDLCSVWCGPCNVMAKTTQSVFAAFFSNPSVKFEYVTLLVDGPNAGTPSTKRDAQGWATRHKINRPVLHADSLASGGTWLVGAESEMCATPTLRLVDPDGVIRWLNVGAVAEESTFVRILANVMGIPVPASSAAARLLGGTEVVHYGDQVASSDTDPVLYPNAFPFILPEGTFGYDFYSQLTMARDPYSGVEHWSVDFVRYDWALGEVAPLATEQPWQFTLSNLVLDPLVRTLPPGTTASVGLVLSNNTQVGVPVALPVTWDGSTLAFGALTPEMLAPYGPILQLSLRVDMHAGDFIAGVAPAAATAFAMRAPAPNPALRATTLAWTQARAGEARLDVFDVGGRLVRTLARGAHAAGEHALAWDLADAAGTPVRAGLYFARVSVAGEGIRTTRVTVMR